MDQNLECQSLRDHILSYHTTPSEADKPESPKSMACLGCAVLHTAKQLEFSGLRSALLRVSWFEPYDSLEPEPQHLLIHPSAQ